MHWRAGSLLVLLALPIGGCGVAFMHGPPAGNEHMWEFRCSQSYVPPLLDGVLGAVFLVAGFTIASDPSEYGYPENARGNLIAAGVLEAAFLGASSAVGFDKVNRCRAALAQLATRQARIRSISAPPGTPVARIRVGPSQDTIVVGESLQLEAVALGAGRIIVPQPVFAWSSSDNAVAWVTRTGLVTALAPGTVLIDASAEDVIGTVRLVVRPR